MGLTTDEMQNGAPLNGAAGRRGGEPACRFGGRRGKRLCKRACVVAFRADLGSRVILPPRLPSDKLAKDPIGSFRSVSYKWLKSIV